MGHFTKLQGMFLAIFFAALVVGGCNGGGKHKTLTITSPTNNATISRTDDLSDASGIQIDVTCRVDGFQRGDEIFLRITDEAGNESATSVQYDESGQVVFTQVSFEGGTIGDPADYVLRCSDRNRNIVSTAVNIHVVEDVICPDVNWLDPQDGFAWNATDDANGSMDDGFQHAVSLLIPTANEGITVSLYINGNVAGSTSVTGGQVNFGDVDFPTAHDLNIEIRIGVECNATTNPDYGISGTLDVDVPECQITQPTGVEWLNLDDDTDPAAGLQVQVVVTTDMATTAELFIDDVSAGTHAFSGTTASFDAVSLADGPLGSRCIRATCTDDAGNRGFSGESCYGVDSEVPTISITDPTDGTAFNDQSDVNDTISGVQIEVDIVSNQMNTTVELWANTDCSGAATPMVPEGTPTTDALAGTATGQITFPSMDGDVSICARVERPSGNFGTDSISVNFDTEAPQVDIVRPTPVPDPIPDPPPDNADDGLILIADDEVPFSTSGNHECEYTVLVDCEIVGRPVELWSELDSTGARATANCETCTATDCTLPGRATFSQQNMMQSGLSPHSIYAVHTDAAGNVGQSTNVPIMVDTVPPQPVIVSPTCGSTVNLSPPFETTVLVRAGETPRTPPDDVTLNIFDGSDNPVTGSPYTVPNSSVTLRFEPVTFVEGQNRIEACTVDRFDQTGCNATCNVTISNVPQVIFVTPIDGASLGLGDDTDSGTAGLQISVTFTSDVAAGSSTRLVVNSTDNYGPQNYTASGVTYTGVTIIEGSSISIMGCATDTRGEGCTTIHVDADLTAPSSITNVAITMLDRREGRVRLDWTAPSDSGATVAGYDIRCDNFAITAANYDTARSFSYTGVPAAPGNPDSQEISGLFAGLDTTYWCAVKAFDAADNMGPISNIPSTTEVRLLSTEIDGPTGTADNFGLAADSVGDVDGDGFEDFMVGSVNNRVLLYFGSATGVNMTKTVTINGNPGENFGSAVCGIGNFDGDGAGLDDIAIGAQGTNAQKGAVYIFLGRSTWPSVLTHSDANMQIVMDDPSSTNDDSSRFGQEINPAGDFNNDGRNDIIIAAPRWGGTNGTAFIILGRSSVPALLTVPGDRSTGFVGDFQLVAPVASGRFGTACDALGRVNSDNLYDIACAAPATAAGGTVYVYYGRSAAGSGVTNISTANKTIVSPVAAAIGFGNELVGPGDVNGDGRVDLLVGAPSYPTGTDRHGAVYVFYNSGSEIEENHDSIITNASASPANDFLGLYLARGVDLGYATDGRANNDTRSDVFIGSLAYDAGSGHSFVYLGSTTFPATTTTALADMDIAFPGSDPGGLSSKPRYVGDINGDGFSDLSVGYVQFNANQGKVIVYY